MPIDIENDDLQTALAKLKAREETLQNLEAIAKLGSWEIDLKTGRSIWSPKSYEIYGFQESEVEPTLELFLSLVIPKDLQKVQNDISKCLESGKATSLQCRVKRKDGEILDLLLNGKVVYDEQNTPLKIVGSTQDFTETMKLQRDTQALSELIENSSNEIYIIKKETLAYLYVNRGACEAIGYSSEEMLQMDIFDINPGLTMDAVMAVQASAKPFSNVLNRTIHQRKDRTRYPVQSLIHPMQYHDEDAYVIFGTDISKQAEDEQLLKEQAKKLSHQANHDTLTNLPNRTLFKDRLSQAIIFSKRNRRNFAVLFIDLDHFKKINDSLGHHVGDEVLIEAANRLKESLREEDTLARLGGDEFTIILQNIKSIQDVSNIAEKIVHRMRQSIQVDNHKLFISSSIGISLYPQDSSKSQDLLKFADTAMYKAKDEGRNNYQFYSSDMTAVAFEKVVMDSSLRIAIKEEQFLVYYQPQFDTSNNQIVGMEALIRWQHPQIGLVSPGKFIPIAEESGLIIEIDSIVMRKAMKQFAQWYTDGLNPGKLALNLSMKQLNEKDFITKLLNTMNSLAFRPQWLELEVTEGQIMNNPNVAIEKLKKISDIGIEIAIDDFGTGYSSLAYLKKLPLDKLKIDQSFIQEVDTDEDDAAITKAIIALGKSLNMKLIAEGVETADQRDFLIAHGCEYIQGYLYGKPMPAKEITKILLK